MTTPMVSPGDRQEGDAGPMHRPRHLTSGRRERRASVAAARVRRVVEEACNKGNLAVLDELLAPPDARGVVDRGGEQPEADSGSASPERLRELLAAFRSAVPDACWQIVEQIAERNTVVTRLSVRGTFSGAVVGLAPPGRPATLTGVAISRFARGRLVALWLQADLLDFLQQLGVLPPLALTQVVTMAQVLRAGSLLAAGPAPRLSPQAPRARGGTRTPPIPLAPTHVGTKGVTSMYARLVTFALQNGKGSIATDLARDLVPEIRQQPGCQAVTCFGDSESGQYYLYVLWSSEEEANAAASVMAPRLERHLAGNTVAPPERHLYPVIESA